jgi:short-subunit dehydrogenase
VNNTAWIVGASSGIGSALALELATLGWRVAVSSRNYEALDAVQTRAGSGAVVTFPVDVTDAQELSRVARDVEARVGPVTHCFLNAALYEPMRLDSFDARLFRRTLEVNVMGVVHGIEAILPGMRRRRSGQILVTASLAGYRGLPGAAPYNASKAALISLAESLRPELEREGILIRVVNPGFVRTPMTAKNDFPMPALIEPEEAASRIVRALHNKGFEIAFPMGFALLMKLLRILPYALYFALTRRMLR